MRHRYFAQFYSENTAGVLLPVKKATTNIDGRRSSSEMDLMVIKEAIGRGFDGVQIRFGTYANPRRFGQLIDVRPILNKVQS